MKLLIDATIPRLSEDFEGKDFVLIFFFFFSSFLFFFFLPERVSQTATINTIIASRRLAFHSVSLHVLIKTTSLSWLTKSYLA